MDSCIPKEEEEEEEEVYKCKSRSAHIAWHRFVVTTRLKL
jgi:hypothetical protein